LTLPLGSHWFGDGYFSAHSIPSKHSRYRRSRTGQTASLPPCMNNGITYSEAHNDVPS
jgi:hypothetical protein